MVVQLAHLHVAEVDEFLFHLAHWHVLELSGVERLFAHRRFYWLVARLINLFALAVLALLNVDGNEVVVQVLFGYSLNVFNADSHNLILVVQNFFQVLLVVEGVHQQVANRFVVFHHQVETATHFILDGFDFPLFEFAVGNLLDSL